MFLWGTRICLILLSLILLSISGVGAESLFAVQVPMASTGLTDGDVGGEDQAQFEVLTVPPELLRAQAARVATIEKSKRATVSVFGSDGQGGGSGVVISPDGYALTNYHVVQGNGPFMKCSMPDGVLYDAVIVGIDPTGDVALLKLLGRDDFPFATMADSDQIRVGDWCFAIGNPFLLATNFQPSVSMGIISGKNRYQYPAGTLLEYADCLQTDAAINPGNSGGALFDANGDLIGINGRGSFEKRGRVNVGVGYAISINQIKYFLDHLKSGRLVDHATLGATVESDSEGVVRFSDVLPTSDAFGQGIRYDDVLVSFAGRSITSVNQFKNVLGILPQGFTVPIVFRRDDVETTVTVRLAGVHAAGQLAEMIDGESGIVPRSPERPDREPDQAPGNRRPDGNPDQPQRGSGDSGEDEPPTGEANLFSQTLSDVERGMFIRRRGFTNYYFNQFNRDRIWQGFRNVGGRWDQQPGRWRISGQLQDSAETNEVPFQLFLGDQRSGIRIGDASFVLDPSEDLSQQLVPPGSGGLLVALHLWRAMLIEQPEKFGDVYYFGTLPIHSIDVDPRDGDGDGEGEERLDSGDERDGLVEVLVATRGVTETHFRFSPKQSLLESLELFPEINSSPCRIEFTDYQRDGDLLVPRQIRYRHDGGSADGPATRTLVIERIEFLEKRDDRSDR